MATIELIVEGDGEITAVPALVYKVLHALNRYDVLLGAPKNAHGKGNLTAPGGIEKFVQYALFEPDAAGVLVIVDADDDCPVELARELAIRVMARNPRRPVAIVVANRTFESWILASIDTVCGKELQGRPGLRVGLVPPRDADQVSGIKGWLSEQMEYGRAYKETEDQAPMIRLIDLDAGVARSRSLKRLVDAVRELLDSAESALAVVSPA